MKFQIVGLVLLSFLAGLIAAPLLEGQQQLPRSPLTAEKASPQDWIPEKDIHVYQNEVVLDIQGAKWATFADTNSMDPLFDAESNAIQIEPVCSDLSIGDIITYDYQNRKIIHRIVDIQQDAQGTYYIVKGDNNDEVDPVRVRCDDIERVVVAIVY